MGDKSILLFAKTMGLNVGVDPARATADPESGAVDLVKAVNVDIDESGRISRTKGFVERRSDASHSIWSNGLLCYYVSSDSLYELRSDWSRRGIRSGLTLGVRMSYCHLDGKTYYSNGVENGVIWESDGLSHVWQGEAYVGPETIYEVSVVPPVGSLLELHSGRMLIAQGRVLWYSMQFAFSWYRSSRDYYELDSNINMLHSVGSGVWVGCQYDGVYWLQGGDASELSKTKKSSTPVISGASVVVPGEVIDRSLGGQQTVMWASADGLHLGLMTGEIIHLTENRLVLPSGITEGSCGYFNRKCLFSFEP